jgi:hypothetical protein
MKGAVLSVLISAAFEIASTCRFATAFSNQTRAALYRGTDCATAFSNGTQSEAPAATID